MIEWDDDVEYDNDCDGCTCCRRGRCYRGARSDCRFSDQLGYLCPCTED